MKTSLYYAILGAALLASQSAHAVSITLTGTVRDFFYNGTTGALAGNPDFQNALGDDRGIVQNTLGADGAPLYNHIGGSSSTTHGQTAFDQWYHNSPGNNLSTSYDLVLNETAPGSGIYSYFSGAFFPIDGQLGGNQGDGHNYAFTYQIHTAFTYQTGQTFDFAGDDDVWVFINKKLVIDLGGVHGQENASVNLDTLSLTAGNLYDFDFFFAERHTTGSNLKLTTSIQLLANQNVPDAGFTLGYLLVSGIALAAFRRGRATR